MYMVNFACKVTNKSIIHQSFLWKKIKISVIIDLYKQNAGTKAHFIGKNRGRNAILACDLHQKLIQLYK